MNNGEEEIAQRIIIALSLFFTGHWRPIAPGEEG